MFGANDPSSWQSSTWDGYYTEYNQYQDTQYQDTQFQDTQFQDTQLNEKEECTPGPDAAPSPEYDPFTEGPAETKTDDTADAPGQAVQPETVPDGCQLLSWQKSGWMARCVLLIALWKKGHFNKMQDYMWKFADHHTIRMHVKCLESSLQKYGEDVGPWKLGYNF